MTARAFCTLLAHGRTPDQAWVSSNVPCRPSDSADSAIHRSNWPSPTTGLLSRVRLNRAVSLSPGASAILRNALRLPRNQLLRATAPGAIALERVQRPLFRSASRRYQSCAIWMSWAKDFAPVFLSTAAR